MSERQRSAKTLQNQDSLKGQAFHSLSPDGRAQSQGELIKDLGGGLYLAQYYSWIMGDPTNQRVIAVTELARCHPNGNPVYQLYASMEDANFQYEYGINTLKAPKRQDTDPSP